MCRKNHKEFKLQQYNFNNIKAKIEIFVTSWLRNYSSKRAKRHVVFKTEEDIMEQILGKIIPFK